MKKFVWLVGLMFSMNVAFAENNAVDVAVEKLQHEWAIANYKTAENRQEDAFKALSELAHQMSANHPGQAELLVWEAIITSGYAKAKGGIGALSLAETARDLLLKAEAINPQVLHGSIYTTLGSLYYKVPGWPLGFGDKKKARAYLEKALKMNPSGIDPNYFYADYLLNRHDYAKAIDYYKKALSAPARVGREDADAGRRNEIIEGLKEAEAGL
jgi:tetratricopeptide (TPR) repeat protein